VLNKTLPEFNAQRLLSESLNSYVAPTPWLCEESEACGFAVIPFDFYLHFVSRADQWTQCIIQLKLSLRQLFFDVAHTGAVLFVFILNDKVSKLTKIRLTVLIL
jgi:hypothetical protein